MDELVIESSTGEVTLSLAWEGEPTGTAADATRGQLRVAVRGNPVWYGETSDHGFEWSWVELVEFLGESWRYLVLEEGTPLGVAIDTAPRMLAAAEAVLEADGPAAASADRELLYAFTHTHDLSEAVQGANLPAIWVIRDGSNGWICTPGWIGRVPVDELLKMLVQLGDAIIARLASSTDMRAVAALGAWNSRQQLSRLEIIEAATGYPAELVADVESAFLADDERDWHVARSDVLLAAARLLGPLPLATLAPILTAVRRIPPVATPVLDELSRHALEVLEAAQHEQPYEQGYTLALWLRAQHGIEQASGRVDPDALLSNWGVPTEQIALDLVDLDAIGCWGDHHGPGIVLNTDGAHAQSVGGLRATLAHEIAHLLVDRAGSLPLAEVLGGRTARHVEQRARAFAAELLLPRARAASLFVEPGIALDRALADVMSVYGVSSEVVAWQVRNSREPVEERVRRFFSGRVSRPLQY
jgi:Zn-dependent peptidase ImmA (M78 family)